MNYFAAAMLLILTIGCAYALDCPSGWGENPWFRGRCVQTDCESITHAHYSSVGDCVCGSSGSIHESRDDPNQECMRSREYSACPGCVYKCLYLTQECPNEGSDWEEDAWEGSVDGDYGPWDGTWDREAWEGSMDEDYGEEPWNDDDMGWSEDAPDANDIGEGINDFFRDLSDMLNGGGEEEEWEDGAWDGSYDADGDGESDGRYVRPQDMDIINQNTVQPKTEDWEPKREPRKPIIFKPGWEIGDTRIDEIEFLHSDGRGGIYVVKVRALDINGGGETDFSLFGGSFSLWDKRIDSQVNILSVQNRGTGGTAKGWSVGVGGAVDWKDHFVVSVSVPWTPVSFDVDFTQMRESIIGKWDSLKEWGLWDIFKPGEWVKIMTKQKKFEY